MRCGDCRREEILRGHDAAGSDHDRGDRRRDAGRSENRDREMVQRQLEGDWAEAGCDASGGAAEYRICGDRARPEPVAEFGELVRDGGDYAIRSGLLSAAAWESRAGRRVLRHAAVP